MKIKIDELQTIISLLLSKLKEVKGNEIELHNDYYWDIKAEELFNPIEEPKDFLLGQISDDLEEVLRLLREDDVIMYDLKRMADIFKALSLENLAIPI